MSVIEYLVKVSEMYNMQSFKEYITESDEHIKSEFEVPEHNLEYLQKRVAKLNKTAAKLGLTPIKVTVGDSFIKEIEKEKKSNSGEVTPAKYVNVYNVKVEGETPKLAGWSFVGKLEPIPGSSEIMAKTAPGAKQLPKRFQHVDHVECEHCKINRYRKESFIVKKGRTYKQIGRSCLKDFLGHEDPKKIADWAEVMYDLEAALSNPNDHDSDYSGGHGFMAGNTEELIARSLVSIRAKGFQSKQYGDYPTSVAVIDSFNPPRYPNSTKMSVKEWYESFMIPTTEEDMKQAKEIRAWLIKRAETSNNEFDINTGKLVKGDVVAFKSFGYVCAATNSWLKEVANEHAKKQVKVEVKDEHVGNIGDKHKMTGVVVFKHVYSSYGQWASTKAIILVKLETGHLVKMFTTNTSMEKGDKVELSGKIGRHEVETYDKSPFHNMRLTIMAPGTRIKILEMVDNK
jgi:hypothetical protein